MENAYQQYSDLLFAKAGARGIPLSGSFELTARCNLDCRMCYIHRKENDRKVLAQEQSAAQWLRLAEVCSKAGMLMLLLTGGEPLLRPDFREIYTGCRRLGLMVSLNSNATLIDQAMVDFFAEDPPTRVNISLYGASRETYGALCGHPEMYDRVIWAIQALRERGISVKLNFCVTPYNRQDAEQIYLFAKEQKLPIQTATYLFPPIRACEQGTFSADRLSPEEAAGAQIFYDRFRFPEQELRERWEAQLHGIRQRDPDEECQDLPTERLHCRAGYSTFWVTWDGKLRPCGMMSTPSLDLDDPDTFPQSWEQLRRVREDIVFPAKCTECENRHVCDICPALGYAETGSFDRAPTYVCEKTEAYLREIRRELNTK